MTPRPTKSAHPTRLPPGVSLHARFAGALCQAWIERWTRHIFTIAGPAAKSCDVIISMPNFKHSAARGRLISKLGRWGYYKLTLTRTEDQS
jgi:hypothetical protein